MATVAKTIAMNSHGSSQRLGEGNKTQVVYRNIAEGHYDEVIKILTQEVENRPRERAALSLLGYCHYYKQDFENAAKVYEQLVRFYPNLEEYKVYYAQSLYKAGMYEEAMKAAQTVEDSQVQHAYQMLHLQAAVKYEMDDLDACKTFVDRCMKDDPDTIVTYAAILYKEGDLDAARVKFTEAKNLLGFQPDIMYNIALCHYKMQQFGDALRYIGEIIDRGARDHPELDVGNNHSGVEMRSVGNSQTLQDTGLIQAFNLKAAIEFQMKNFDAAREALNDMPPRNEDELDPVTLHNHALMHMDGGFGENEADPSGGFTKLNYLLNQREFPPETFGNLLILYCQNQYYDLAGDVLAENAHLKELCLSTELYEYLEATILTQSSPEEAFRKLDKLSEKHIVTLRKLTKQIQEARLQSSNELIRDALKEYDDAVERYIPVLMAQARIYWDIRNYSAVEKLFKQSAEFCGDHDVWKLNVAHVFFMQERFKDATRYYDLGVKKKTNILDVPAIVLANLCVSYIMTGRNKEAEVLMKSIENAEDRLQREEEDVHMYHLCIVNLVIGTLYCSKGQYKFGIGRIIKSLEPYDQKLSADTWYYAKRCVLALLEMIAKHMIVVKDDFRVEIMAFLTAAEKYGKDIITKILDAQGAAVDKRQHNVAFEARLFKRAFMHLDY